MEQFTDKDELIEYLKMRIMLLEKELKFIKKSNGVKLIDCGTQYDLTLLDDFNLYKINSEKKDLSIADMIRETSETYLSDSGYSYEEKTGLYYHSESGYYYDPHNLLFYNPKNGCYYSYDSETQEYKYHSRDNAENLSRLSNEMLWRQGYQHKPPKDTGGYDDNYLAPCMRIMTEETGDLHILTCSGGTIGTSKDHNVLVPSNANLDVDLRIIYEAAISQYCIYRGESDLHGDESLLNGEVITRTPRIVKHHSKLVICNHSFLLHIHEDYTTCEWCEPGLVKVKINNNQNKTSDQNESNVKKSQSRYVVNQLKVKYGLKNSKSCNGFWRQPKLNTPAKYVDRAQIRRKKEKDEQASEIKEQSVENPALKMMSKMGWNPGDSLGKSGTGITEPISVEQRINSRAGIGCDDKSVVQSDCDPKTLKKLRTRDETRKRYNLLFNK